MTEPRGSLDHASHDTFVVASLATREPDAGDEALVDARSLVERCSDCADLYADLVAIAAAAPTAAVPPRPRDFRLTDADVARLSPRGWRRFLRTIGSPGDAISRPLALGFTTLGIAGLIAASIPGMFAGAGGAASLPATLSTVGSEVDGAPSQAAPAPSDIAAPAAAPSAEALTQTNRPDTTDGDTSNVFEGSGEGNQGDDGRSSEASEPGLLAIRDDPTGMSVLAVIAGSLLIVGLAIFLLRWSARRFGD